MRKAAPKTSKARSTFELKALEETVGHFMHYWGFKKIHGRIWVHLFTSSIALDSSELMQRLRVSKGLMSLAIRDLLEHNVILPDHSGRHGTTYYRANPDLHGVITGVLRKRELPMLEESRKSCLALIKLKKSKIEEMQLDPSRVEAVLDLTQSAQALLQMFLVPREETTSPGLFDTFLEQEKT